MTQVASFDDADRFLKLARTFLLQAPRRNTIILSVVDRLRGTFGHGARFYVMDEGGAVIGAAMQTPPFRLFLAASEEAAVAALLDWLSAHGESLPGVVGLETLSSRFADGWSRRVNVVVRKAKTLRLYSLDAVTPSPSRAAGRGRLADESDRELVLDWFRDFAETVGLPAHQREAIRDEAAAFLEAGTVYVWEDRGDCRAMVSHTPAGLAPGRIRAVYAPPGSRGHGYASACVCYVCRVLRDEKGWPYCLLFADVDSAPANRLYQRVGFKLLHTFQEYDFED